MTVIREVSATKICFKNLYNNRTKIHLWAIKFWRVTFSRRPAFSTCSFLTSFESSIILTLDSLRSVWAWNVSWGLVRWDDVDESVWEPLLRRSMTFSRKFSVTSRSSSSTAYFSRSIWFKLPKSIYHKSNFIKDIMRHKFRVTKLRLPRLFQIFMRLSVSGSTYLDLGSILRRKTLFGPRAAGESQFLVNNTQIYNSVVTCLNTGSFVTRLVPRSNLNLTALNIHEKY